MALRYEKCEETGPHSLGIKPTSMCSLIIWNISKALENKSCLDLKHAIRSAHERLERDSRDDDGMISQPPEQRHLTCALLAWQQLGHKDADSLYQFVEENRYKSVQNDSENSSHRGNIDFVNKTCVLSPKSASFNKQTYSEDIDTSSFDTVSLMGPVVKLPVGTRIVMRMENPCNHHSVRKSPKVRSQNDISNKIDAACCKDSVCVQRLAELDTAVKELRSRAAKLARREAERVELLERAEAAWKDLELGYQRRIYLAEEKEDDLEKQIKKAIEERNSYKTACTNLSETLKQRGEIAEKERSRLVEMEKQVCERACVRLQFTEESSQHDAALAEQLCRTIQLDRDLQFREVQARRKVWLIENDVESARCLTHEAERTMRIELAALKDQIKQVSEQLMAEETENQNIKLEVEELRQEKSNIIEDLDGCKEVCDSRMQGRIDELNKKRDHLMELKEKVIECRCKLPIDISIEVKRTPSLAAFCHCSPEDKLLDSCSCTSLRSQLLTNLLTDLFGGLQSEISSSGSIMPCHLLKCLEEKHNWDRSSIVKTNLRNFFSKLLVGELDIAIATSIEKYHAKWVGKSCADQVRAECGEDEEGWQERAIERRAQKLASKFAEQLFKERADLLTKKAKDIVSKGPPPCQCKNQPAVYPCIVKTPTTNNNRKNNEPATAYLKRTIQDVTRLRQQIEDLKKESVKKEDLWQMEDKIAKIVQRASIPDNIPSIKKGKYNHGINVSEQEKFNKQNVLQKFSLSNSSRKSFNYKGKSSGKVFKRTEQTYAVNICLCGPQKNCKKVIKNYRHKDIKSWNSKTSNDIIRKITNIRRSQPIKFLCSQGYDKLSPHKSSRTCPSEYVCFHKVPSNTSIDKLLETLIKWKGDLALNSVVENNKIKNNKECSNSKFAISESNVVINNCNQLVSDMKAENGGFAEHFCKYSNTIIKTSHKADDKSTDYLSILPPTTDSVYIGQINLDRSNDDLCKCNINQYIKEINNKDGNKRLSDDIFTSVNTDICRCVHFPEINHVPQQNILHNVEANGTVSQCFSGEFNKSTFENIKGKKSEKSLDVIDDTYISHDIARKSEVLPLCNYQVNLLGVTLTNINELDNNQDIKENYVKLDTVDKTMPDYKSQIQCNIIDAKSEEFYESIINNCCEQNSKTKEISEVTGDAESSCVCCDEKELSKDLEINAFNLIEEYLKEKLAEIKKKCKSTCLHRQEERQLFSTILQRIKAVISDSTNPRICKYTGLDINDVSWSRAYDLLQEYIKIKIKRVQSLPRDVHENSVVPIILEKICNLIENDFQRLKDKCKCENKRNKDQYDLKDLDISTNIQTSDILADIEKSKNDIILERFMEDSAFQISSHVPVETKSCGAMSNIVLGLNTAEKLISCELTNVYATDCRCTSNTTTLYGLNREIVISPITISNGVISNENDNFATNISNEIYETSNVASLPSLKKNAIKNISNEYIHSPITKYPYYGYTLSCSCDHSLGKCHCIKSMIQTNNDKIDFMWESLKSGKCPKIMSYIMSKIPATRNIKSEPVSKTDNTDLYTNSLQFKYDIKYSNRETVTTTSENFVLKVSKEKINLDNTKSDVSTDMDVVEKEYSHSDKPESSENKLNDIESFQNDAEYDKHLLYDSLYLPTEKISKDIKNETFSCSDENLKFKRNKCDCKMVPVCHVKMLVDNIEKKLMEFKCTCDSLDSRICPVHSRGEFYLS